MARLRAMLPLVAGALVLASGSIGYAQDTPSGSAAGAAIQGLWLTTSFPLLTEHIGDNIRLDLDVQNKALPPRRVAMNVDGLPAGWTYEFDGGGKPVTAPIVGPDSSQSLALKITPPKDAKTGNYQFDITGKSGTESLDLPITLVLAEAKPATVTIDPKLPALRGSPNSSFDYDLTIKNDGAEDQTFNLLANGPPGFNFAFNDQYGSQELTSLPVKAGESHTVKLSVKPPVDVSAGQYQVEAQAAGPAAQGSTHLVLDVTGQPKLVLSGPEGRLSGDATAGKQRSFNFTLQNTGTAPAQSVKFDSTPPAGWKVTFDPKTIETIASGQNATVQVTMTPPDNAIAGDYMVDVGANGDGTSDSQSFRVTVLTSTMWGIAGLGVIGAAVIVLAAAVTRYGRR